MEYEIVLADRLDDHWSASFEGMQLRRARDGGGTALCGHVPDQAALHGVLTQVRDLGLTLLAVRLIHPAGGTAADPEETPR